MKKFHIIIDIILCVMIVLLSIFMISTLPSLKKAIEESKNTLVPSGNNRYYTLTIYSTDFPGLIEERPESRSYRVKKIVYTKDGGVNYYCDNGTVITIDNNFCSIENKKEHITCNNAKMSLST